MVRIGLVGLGPMGVTHYHAYQRVAGGAVTALCSRDPAKRSGDWSGVRASNLGPSDRSVDLSGVTAHATYGDLLADPDVDLVDLCVPGREHERLAVEALQAGKDVVVEKPIALDTAAADRMIAAARRTGRRLLVAHLLPFFPEFGYLLEAVRSRSLGHLLALRLERAIAWPSERRGVADVASSGGPAIDLHVHDTHLLLLLAGMPNAVKSRGVMREGVLVHVETLYDYGGPEGLIASASCGALGKRGRPFVHGFEAHFERGTLSYRLARGEAGSVAPLTLCGDDGASFRPLGVPADPLAAFTAEFQAVVEDSTSGAVSHPALDPVRAREALAICEAEMESVRSGLEVRTGGPE